MHKHGWILATDPAVFWAPTELHFVNHHGRICAQTQPSFVHQPGRVLCTNLAVFCAPTRPRFVHQYGHICALTATFYNQYCWVLCTNMDSFCAPTQLRIVHQLCCKPVFKNLFNSITVMWFSPNSSAEFRPHFRPSFHVFGCNSISKSTKRLLSYFYSNIYNIQ